MQLYNNDNDNDKIYIYIHKTWKLCIYHVLFCNKKKEVETKDVDVIVWWKKKRKENYKDLYLYKII